MTKIKIVGALIFVLSIILAILSGYISNQTKINTDLLNNINTQKGFTQEISKTIFYIYKNQNTNHKELNNYIKKFANNMNNQKKNFTEISNSEFEKQNKKIIKLWNEFYLYVQHFRDQSKITTTYSNIILQKIVNDIYNKNLALVIELDNLIKIHKSYLNNKIDTYKNIQYALFFLLVLLLIYLFTQIKVIISFIQKFLSTSEKIITTSSIKDLKQIEINNNSADIQEATDNFNQLVNNINTSIKSSSSSIEHSCKSLELVERNIEDLLELLSVMEGNNSINKDLTKKEDALIQSLEELTTSAQNLKNLKIDLDNLISHHNSNKS